LTPCAGTVVNGLKAARDGVPEFVRIACPILVDRSAPPFPNTEVAPQPQRSNWLNRLTTTA